MALCFAPLPASANETDEFCPLELVVLGAGQDAGAPQIGNADDNLPPLLPSSLAIIDRKEGKRYLFDASPAITKQLVMLDRIEPPKNGLGVDAVFLTHAHIGHYLGLAYFGREAAGATGIPVYAMPRMADFLRSNGPWSQLVELGNITLEEMGRQDTAMIEISPNLSVIPFLVPHRDEYSETVGFVILTPGDTALYLPDLDGWEELLALRGEDGDITKATRFYDHVFIDGTFWVDNELSGRDMSEIPHPRVTQTMDLLQGLPASERAKVHFIHYNHTNPIRDPGSSESREVTDRGFNIARRGDRHCLVARQ